MKIAGFLAMVVLVAGPTWADDRKADLEGVDFFESRVRPVLVEHCYKCHSAQSKPIKGGLRLDSLDAMQKGGAMGPAVVPGDVNASLLVHAVRYQDEALRMPPKGKLADPAIASIEHWVKGGAVVPHAAEVAIASPVARKSSGIDFGAASQHGLIIPFASRRCPTCGIVTGRSLPWIRSSWRNSKRAGSPLLRRRSARAAPPRVLRPDRPAADRRGDRRFPGRPVRRTPSPRSSIACWPRPHYGERWGRHWLDVARYADTKAASRCSARPAFPYAYTYRDYVIRALQRRHALRQFIREQIAADRRAEGPDRAWPRLGFLTVGKLFATTSTTRSTTGSTRSARNPRPHGRLRPVPRPQVRLRSPRRTITRSTGSSPVASLRSSCRWSTGLAPTRRRSLQKQAEAKRRKLMQFREGQYKILSEAARQRTPDYLVKAATTPPDPLKTAIFFLSLAPDDLARRSVARWRRYLKERSRRTIPCSARGTT